MDPNKLPHKMTIARPILERLESLAQEFALTRREVALGFIKHEAPGTQIVFGAETAEQVRENLGCWIQKVPPHLGDRIRETFPAVDEDLINPSRWNHH